MLEKILVLLVVGIIAMTIFGSRLPQVLGDLGKGVRAFKDGMNEGSGGDSPQPKRAAGGRKPAVKKAAAKKTK